MGAGRLKASSTHDQARLFRLPSTSPTPEAAATPSSRPGTPPSSFLCPIHLEIMSDPVTLHTGMTYDRVSIETWLMAGHNTCPVTNQPLLHHDFIPNHALRRAILTWGTADPRRIPTLPAKLTELMSLLHSITTDSSLHRLASVLPKLEDQNKRALFGDPSLSSSTLATQLSTLLSSSNPSSGSKVCAAEILHALCEADRTHVGTHPDAIKALTKLLREGSKIPESLLKCLFSLCKWNKKNRVVAIECHAVSVLMDLMAEPMIPRAENARVIKELCCGIVESLAICAEGREAIRDHPVGVAMVVESLLGVSDVATEHAVGALWGLLALAVDRRSVMHGAMHAGVFGMLLMVMSSDCSSRAKDQARQMLKMLNEVRGSSGCGNLGSDYGVSAADVGLLRGRHQVSKRS